METALYTSARVVADSISRAGIRITTMVVILPRIMLAEFNTHRVLSRNSASSRAIPLWKQLLMLINRHFVPSEFGTAVAGMNAGPNLEGKKLEKARGLWEEAFQFALLMVLKLFTSGNFVNRELRKWRRADLGSDQDFVKHVAERIEKKDPALLEDNRMLQVTKGLVNRLLEPFMYQEIVVTFTEIENFLNLRTDNNAQLEIRVAAQMMKAAYEKSEPVLLEEGEWHLPFLQEDEKEWAKAYPDVACLAMAARCARVSYLTHDSKGDATAKPNLQADLKLAIKLESDGHMSPFEHVARPFSDAEVNFREDLRIRADQVHNLKHSVPEYFLEITKHQLEFVGNFRGFVQYRTMLKNQRVYQPPVEQEAV
jgi:thymidylate synthase ThyX